MSSGIRSVHCSVKWQVLRVGTLPRYNSKGGWNTLEGVEQNLRDLHQYYRAAKFEDERNRRLYRVRSLLLHTLREYRDSGRMGTQVYARTLSAYNATARPSAVVKPIGYHDHGWRGVALSELKALQQTNPDMFNNVRREIGTYLRRAQGDQSALQLFYDLMVEVSIAQ